MLRPRIPCGRRSDPTFTPKNRDTRSAQHSFSQPRSTARTTTKDLRRYFSSEAGSIRSFNHFIRFIERKESKMQYSDISRQVAMDQNHPNSTILMKSRKSCEK
jgi:hypothetical protein